MEDRNELSDIVLEKEDNKVLKIKRILIIAALLILIFLVALVVMKVINKPTEQNSTSKLILPPEPTTSTDTQAPKEDNLFKQVPITQESTKKESFEDMVKSLKEKEVKKQAINTNVNKTPAKEIITQNLKKTTPKKITTIIETQKAVLKQVKIKTKVKSITSNNNGISATKGIYIQVGATSRLTPDKKFLKKITSKNYAYRLLKIQIKDKKVTKILIGPYTNTSSAKNVINDIKTNINKDAFIYRVK